MANNPKKGSTANNSNFQSDSLEIIKKNRQVTQYNNPSVDKRRGLQDSANYEVVEISPNLELDKDKTYLISGKDWANMLQASLIQALHDILGNRIGFTIDFENWFEDFSYEFKEKVINKKAEITGTNYWGNSANNRPKFEWVIYDDQLWEKHNYHKIKFWQDRLDKDNFIYITGSLTEIRSQLLHIMMSGEGIVDDGTKAPSEISTLSNRPYITLYFSQRRYEITRGKSPARMELTINLMNKKDNEISKNDLREFASRIASIFNTETTYIHTKGKIYFTYHDWANGYHLQILAKNENDARQLLLKILAIKQDELNEKYWKQSTAVNVQVAYPDTEETTTFMGKTYKKPVRRPVVDVVFQWATLDLPSLGKTIYLVSNSKRHPVSTEVLGD